ncbi:MAG: hypothetical protein J7L82_01945 [Staphylothermus sp.]|nr:hypothetical protein [Staphylothermus sp.]
MFGVGNALISYSIIEATNNTADVLQEIISAATSNPFVVISIVIQILLGFALGYFSVKVFRYILAFIGILVLGAILNAWSLGGSIEETIYKYYEGLKDVIPIVKNVLLTLGVLTVGPVSIGFILGLIVGFIKK